MSIALKALAAIVLLLSLLACADHYDHRSYTYYSPDGAAIKAVYHNPRESAPDGSLYSVSLRLPDGTSFDLPQAMAASGVRYSDEKTYLWWTKGDGAFLEKAIEDGSWIILYPDLVQAQVASDTTLVEN